MATNPSQQPEEVWSNLIRHPAPGGMLWVAMGRVVDNLSQLAGQVMEIDTLSVEAVPLDRLLSTYPVDFEVQAVALYLVIEGDLSGEAVFILSPDDAMNLADWLLQRPGTTGQLDSLERSALAEFANVALASFVNAVADLNGLALRLSPPTVVVDILAVILEAVALSAATISDQAVIIKTDLINKDGSVRIQFWVLPDLVTLAVNPVE
ncbi:MAG: chemotaxis protein CheC [Anaerolineae bacterium]|nr:chemotaxis protein CheC [Anaerolineae bacterium]